MNNNHKRISAAVLALALGFSTAGAGIFAPVAGAQISANQISNIDMDADVTLNIEKNVGLPVADGDTSGLEKLGGAQFLIQKIEGIDLQTLAGWRAVAALDPTAITNTLTTIDTITTETTEGATKGTASISTTDYADFTVGVYLVTETAPDGYIGAAPFIVTLPFTDSTGAWSYKQTVKPKNQEESDIAKEVTDAGATLGSEVSYTISSSVPDGTITSLAVEDQLPTELTMVTATEDVAVPADVVVTSGVTTLVPGDDYGVALVSGKLTVTLTATGLAKLESDISVTFKTKITSLPGDESIENHAIININDGAFTYTTEPDPTDPTDPGTGAETRLSQLTINKYNNAETPALITESAAEFELWRCETADEGDTYSVTGTKLEALATSAATTPVSTFATVDGQATLYGVQVMDWVNGETATDTLCIVETKAPTGYSLNPEPQPVNFTEATDDGYAMVANVTNLTTAEAGGGQLPSTGGMGTMALIAGGLVVAAAGGAAAVRGNRARS